MKRTIIGLVSFLLVLASVFGVSSRGAGGRRSARPADRADRVLWI